jgi:hypothetical protein
MSEAVANVAMAAAILLFAISLLLMTVGLVSYWRIRHLRLLWVSLAFLLFAGQGAYVTYLAYSDRAAIASGGSGLPALTVVNLGIVLALYLAVLKR